MQPELVSFNLCPFVQRSVITMLHKNVAHDITYIELDEPPKWFGDISPLGKVPLLKVDGDVLFESAVINEYVDETPGAPLMPSDPVLRAKNRAWIEFGSNLMSVQYQLTIAQDEASVNNKLQEYRRLLGILEKELHHEPVSKPFFNGAAFSLVDTSYAPIFTRAQILSEATELYTVAEFPHVAAWAEALINLDEVKQSVIANFREVYVKRFTKSGSFLVSQLSA